MPRRVLNRKHFFDVIRKQLHINNKPLNRLSAERVRGFTRYLDFWDALTARYPDVYPDSWFAYMLATGWHETGHTMFPVSEIGFGKGKKYGVRDPRTTYIYYGRGDVQLTWAENYKKMTAKIKEEMNKYSLTYAVRRDAFGFEETDDINLYLYPQQALESRLSLWIMWIGMRDGVFTGKKLADQSFLAMRKIINGTDKAALIASYAWIFLNAISYTIVTAPPTGQSPQA